ncbi:MAG: hypothetical protein EA357_11140 [Micavibrio sp.]|nr:MAG: hypothetical protein EA357_11140 [Micavibrio sp.]
MMCFLRIAVYIAIAVQLAAAALVFIQGYSAQERLLALLLAVLPLLAAVTLYAGPSREERKLARELNIARMKSELEELEKKNGQSAKKTK